MAATSSLRLTVDLSEALKKATQDLLRKDLLVGIPADSAPRPPEPGEKAAPPPNSLLGYLHEFGDDEKKIPARPFLMPGVENAKPQIVKGLEIAGRAVLDMQANGLEKGLTYAGEFAVASVQKKIIDGPFAPLSARTLEDRARRRNDNGRLKQGETNKAARRELANRAAGELPSADAKPLYDTHSLFSSVTFVVRDKRDT